MSRYAIVFVILALCILPAVLIPAESAIGSYDGVTNVTIEIMETKVTRANFELQYQIRNDSGDDAWILVGNIVWYPGIREFPMNAEVSTAEGDQTLMIRRRLELPTSPKSIMGPPFYGRYVRLRPGERQTEWISIKIPIHPLSQFEGIRQQKEGLEYATHLAIEFGYYHGDLPEMIFRRLEEEEKIHRKERTKYLKDPNAFRGFLGGVLGLDIWNECLNSRDEEFLIPYGFPTFKGEQVLRTRVDNVRIPYADNQDRSTELGPPDLASCTEVKIQFQPSVLEYFFPYASQRSLLSSEEMENLQSQDALVVEGPRELKGIEHEASKAVTISPGFSRYITGGVVRCRSRINVVCLYDNYPPISFPVYKERDQLLRSEDFTSLLEMLTPQIQAIDLRAQCATNLKNLWYRLRFYRHAEAKRLKNPSIRPATTYPPSTEWCDAMLQPFNLTINVLPLPTRSEWDGETHICPSAREGKNHYAMNPHCEPNSPPDTVLLFETKAGWNQHGGPELFTFDNHDPKGGCVLLNDGTVKFIRTKEELEQLRWK